MKGNVFILRTWWFVRSRVQAADGTRPQGRAGQVVIAEKDIIMAPSSDAAALQERIQAARARLRTAQVSLLESLEKVSPGDGAAAVAAGHAPDGHPCEIRSPSRRGRRRPGGGGKRFCRRGGRGE